MSYGFSISNASGRVMFSTDDNIPVVIGTTPVSVASNTTLLPVPANNELLFVRPQDNESGVISWRGPHPTEVNGPRSVAGCFTPIVSGYKYTLAKATSAVYTPRTSGYGLEVYKTDGSLIFSDEIADLVELTVVGGIPGNGWYVYSNPPGENFNDLYVAIEQLRVNQWDFGIGTPFCSGIYAYFNHTEETITIRAVRADGGSSYPWDVRPYSPNVTQYFTPEDGAPALVAPGFPFFIMRKR